jgi:acetyl-CoA acyltransferase
VVSSLPPQNAQAGTPAAAATARAEIRERADTVLAGGVGPGFPAAHRVAGQHFAGPNGRVAILAGARTPFARLGTDLAALSVVDLAGLAAREAVARSGVDPEEIDVAVFGCVLPALDAPNLGREAVLRAGLPASIPGFAVNLACASANRALVSGAEAILRGEAEVALVGGAESLSNVPLRFPRSAVPKLRALRGARSTTARLAALATLRPRDFAPVPPAIAEYSTGLSMGEACEKMARENGIPRRAQDEIALLSHQRAAAAATAGVFASQIVPVPPTSSARQAVAADNGVRADTSLTALERLPPVFDRRSGTLTAGNSSPLTDGGAALVLASERRLRALGRAPLGFVRSWAFFALPPGGQLLQGPAFAAPLALERAGLRLADVDLVETHEAFAAQVLSNLKALASRRFAREELGRAQPVGEVDLERWNVDGGSIALGHPFGATGARVTHQLLAALGRRGLGLGLLMVCAAGGHGFAMVVERE